MSAAALEAFLARIYMDASARSRFLVNPYAEARLAGLSEEECRSLQSTDWVNLEMAARSFAHKREQKRKSGLLASCLSKLRQVHLNWKKRVLR